MKLRSIQIAAQLLWIVCGCLANGAIKSKKTKSEREGDLLDFSHVAVTGNYTCDELVRWLGTEKHYSNEKKNVLFGILASNNKDKCIEHIPIVLLEDISFGTNVNKRTFFYNPLPQHVGPSRNTPINKFLNNKNKIAPSQDLTTIGKKCSEHDEFAVAYLSNYSINNNFSHFLHGLLRLFCALIDARIIVWENHSQKFIQTHNYTLWLDEWFKLSPDKEVWLKSFGGNIRSLAKYPVNNDCVSSRYLLYGSGCVRLLPPEKWFGYPGCRAGDILQAFGFYMRQRYLANNAHHLKFVDDLNPIYNPNQPAYKNSGSGLRVAFAVRDVGVQTGRRQISNLEQVQNLIRRTQHVKSSMENVTFEHLDVPSTIRYMAGVHIFISVHGAGMTNMFFMNPGAAVVEIIPYPLCNCRSPDYFYGVGGYYHGSAVAQGIKHYHYCVPPHDVKWHKKPEDLKPGVKCSWKHLHAVDSVFVDPTRFVSLMRNVERDLVVDGTIELTKPIINVSPHANG